MAYVLDLAAHSGLPVETVLRVLLRKPTNEDARRRAADAVSALGLPDYPRPDDHIEVLPAAGPEPERLPEPTETWRNVDRRLGRLEKMVERLDRHESLERASRGGAEIRSLDDIRRSGP